MGTKIDLTNQRFGKLVVLEEIEKPDDINGCNWKIKWKCKCDCGNIIAKPTSKLRNGEAIMCPNCALIERGKKRFKDLTGKVFGNLTVIEKIDTPDNVKNKKQTFWKCVCSCGNETKASTSNLNSGHVQRCWTCAHYETNKHKRKDLTGQTFGELTVLEMIYSDRNKSKKTMCRCVCSCGNEKIMSSDTLQKDGLHSCGCKQYEILLNTFAKDIVGEKFGRLLVKEIIYDYENHTKPKVRCLCDCGNEVILNKNDVQGNHTLSCGCLQKDRASECNTKDWTGYISDTGVEILNKSFKFNDKTWIWDCKCPLCKEIFPALPAKVKSGHTTSCGCKLESSLERTTENILINNNIRYERQYSFDDCSYKYKLKFDFAVFNDNNEVLFLIENDGKQHYEPIEYFGGEENFKLTQLRDDIKNEYCKSHNIPLLRLPYYLSKEEMENEIKKVI